MENEHKIPKPLEAFLIIILGFFVTLSITQLAVILFSPEMDEPQKNSEIMKLLITIGELGLGLVPYLYLRYKKYVIPQIFRWKKTPSTIVWLSVPLGISLSIVSDELDRIINMVIPAPEIISEIAESLRVHSGADLVLMLVGAVLVAAIVEESLIRGLLQLSIEKYQNVTRAVIYSSLAWAAIHGILYWALQIFLLGVVLGYLAWRTGSIVPSAICHAINNLMALIFYNIPVSKYLPFYEWKAHVSPLILLPALLIIVYGIRYLDNFYLNLADGESGRRDEF